jgi:predicted nucleotidyltransferase
MKKIIEKNLNQIKIYCRQYAVERLHAFGSVTSDNFTDDSDIDFLIKFKDISFEEYADSYFRLHELFEKLFNRKVDLITENMLSNPYFIDKINRTKIILYEG